MNPLIVVRIHAPEQTPLAKLRRASLRWAFPRLMPPTRSLGIAGTFSGGARATALRAQGSLATPPKGRRAGQNPCCEFWRAALVVARPKRRCAVLCAIAVALPVVASGPARADAPPLSWRMVTLSPRPVSPSRGAPPYLSICGVGDYALFEVAARVAQRQAEHAFLASADELSFDLRAAGDPHAWPRAWALSGSGLNDDEIAHRLGAWASTWTTLGVRRCGVAKLPVADGTTIVVAIAIDALADLSPLPASTRVGQWITLDGTMLIPASGAKVVLLGPKGVPKAVPASLAGDRIHAAFSVDQPGVWLIQDTGHVLLRASPCARGHDLRRRFTT